jgi:hypothetical protein
MIYCRVDSIRAAIQDSLRAALLSSKHKNLATSVPAKVVVPQVAASTLEDYADAPRAKKRASAASRAIQYLEKVRRGALMRQVFFEKVDLPHRL